MDVSAIENPSFLKAYTIEELDTLADNIRAFLVDQISKTGGHLASNMGIVELTIALHKMFDSPKDKLIFDVGHQAYVHKILTGRASKFDSLRQTDGLSGFLKREESIHDVYEAGHSSTSIGAAAGMLFSKPYNSEVGRVIALIGDGSLNSGTALEALNFLGHYPEKNPIIVINDNEMSISPNVGHLSKILTNLRMKRSYRSMKRRTSKMVPRRLRGFTSKVEGRLKGFLAGSNTFETLGYKYFGPIDGHDFKALLRAMETIKKLDEPVVLHVRTVKGKGYQFSENDKVGRWHGCKPFEIENGQFHGEGDQTVSYSDIVGTHLIKKAAIYPTLHVISPAMTAGSGLNEFQKQYPKRYIDAGIAESTSALVSGSLAMQGVKVFLSIYSTFLQRAYDQVIHDIARHNAPVIIGVERAGLVGGDGETHQGIYDIPMLSHVPNLMIAHGKDARELRGLIDYALTLKQPIAIRYARASTKPEEGVSQIDAPTWEIVKKGTKGTIIVFGEFVNAVRELVETHSLDVTLINARFIKPLDEEVLDDIDTTKPLIIHEESVLHGGLGSGVLAHYAKHARPLKHVHLMGFDDAYVPQGKRQELLKRYGLDAMSIIKQMEKMIRETR